MSVNAGGARGGLVRRIRQHAVFREHACAARFAAREGEEEGVTSGIDELVAVFVFFSDFFVRFTLRPAVCDHRGERIGELFKGRTVGGGIRRLAVWPERDVIVARPGGDDARDLDLRRLDVGSAVFYLDALDALEKVESRIVFLLVFDNMRKISMRRGSISAQFGGGGLRRRRGLGDRRTKAKANDNS